TMNTTTATRLKAGDAVTKMRSGGTSIGIVEDDHVRKSGIWKGMISVMWLGASWTVAERPEDLTRIEIQIKPEA
ncbi:hypothetical protein LXJ57_25155, partial [Escherichia coli]|uniref:hypothetical protein n=1 Tax=Escherichia coli TaxID=562 RepID=UPI001E29AAC7